MTAPRTIAKSGRGLSIGASNIISVCVVLCSGSGTTDCYLEQVLHEREPRWTFGALGERDAGSANGCF